MTYLVQGLILMGILLLIGWIVSPSAEQDRAEEEYWARKVRQWRRERERDDE